MIDIDGRDLLAVMPTGYGKSAIYKLVAAVIDGPTVVVSPLIALQRDQTDAINASRKAKPSVFVVDEAHCISSWGHDFRPDYMRLGDVIDELGHPTTIALTATAAPPVQREIIERLHLENPEVVIEGFDRPNIGLSVERFADAGDKDGAVLDRATVLAASSGSGILYVATRRRCEELAEQLNERGPSTLAYHAGMNAKQRDDVCNTKSGGKGASFVPSPTL